MIFTNGRVILGDRIQDDLDVVVRGGKIAELRPRSASRAAIDLRQKFLAPGFVDLHVHGACGRDTMEATEEAFRAICDYHTRGGSTSLLLTTVTAPMEDIISVIDAIGRARRNVPQIAGAHMEGPFISPKKPGAQNRAFICDPTTRTIADLLHRQEVLKRVTIAPEINGAVNAIAAFHAAGVNVSGGHSDAWEEEARQAFDAGMRSVTHIFNCMSSARYRDVYRVAGLLEFALTEPKISCELIADGHHVAPTLMKMVYRAKRLEGISLVTDATRGAGMRDGALFELSGRECIVQNGVCLLADRTALAGSASLMIQLVGVLVKTVGVPLHEAVAMASRNPALQIGLTNKGIIAEGADADLLVISPEFEVEQTFLGGQLVYCCNAIDPVEISRRQGRQPVG